MQFSALCKQYMQAVLKEVSAIKNCKICWVAKKINEPLDTFLEKCLTETIRYTRLKFSEITELVMLLPYSEVLLISSDNDKHTVNEAQNVNKDSLWERLYIHSNEH